MKGLWGETPFVALTLCLSAGILASTRFPPHNFTGLAAGIILLLVAAYIAARDQWYCLALRLGIISIFSVGILLVLSHREGSPPEDLGSLLSRNEIPLDRLVAFDGCVAGESSRRGDSIVTLIQLYRFREGRDWKRCRGKVLFYMTDAGPPDEQIPGRALKYGVKIRGWCRLNIPRSFQNPGTIDRAQYISLRGIQLIGRIKTPRLLEVLEGNCGNAWTRAASRVRSHIHNKLDLLRRQGKRSQAALLESILLGDYSQLDKDIREYFQNSGTYHVLVVSGLHVGWIAWVLVRLFRMVRMPGSISASLLAIMMWFYATIVGFRAGISRSLWMFLLYLLGRTMFRREIPANILFGASFILLAANPMWVFDTGFQLSFLSVAAIIMMGLPLIDKLLKPLLNPLIHLGNPDRLFFTPGIWSYWGRRLRIYGEILIEALSDNFRLIPERNMIRAARLMAKLTFYSGSVIFVSISIQFWLAPLLAFYFNRLSWIAPLANLIVVPLASAVLVVAIAAAILSDILLPASWTFGLASVTTEILLKVTTEISNVPGSWQRCATPSAFWIAGGIGLFLMVSFFKPGKLWLPCLITGIHLVYLSCGCPFVGPTLERLASTLMNQEREWLASPLKLTFLDVGQGDSMVIRFPDTRVWVVDAGGIRSSFTDSGETPSFDTGEAVVSRYLWSFRLTRLDRLILSHPHQDHAGGMAALMNNFPIPRLTYSESRKVEVLTRMLETASARGISTDLAMAGGREYLGEVAIDFLHPPKGGFPGSINDNSMVIRLNYGRFSALLTGDLEAAGEESLLSLDVVLHSLLLKVAHHGSRSATGVSFLDRVRPKWAIISVGRGNPPNETLIRLLHNGAKPFTTSDQGAIFFETDGSHYQLKSYMSGLLSAGKLP